MLPEALLALAAQCAPDVAPTTMLAVVRAESALDPYAIGVNGRRGARPRPSSAAEAVSVARALIAAGRDVDLGLAQINVRNLPRLGLSLEAAFEPCANLSAGAHVLREGYGRGLAVHGAGQAALQVALSYYNTGHASRGFANGYVARVLRQAGAHPAIPRPIPVQAPRPVADWDVFAGAAQARVTTTFVISPTGAMP